MGLDNYWELPEGVDEPAFEPELQLCGGLFSANGSGSFRGKVYNGIVEALTGVSLYEDKIDSEQVKNMANLLNKSTWEDVKGNEEIAAWGISEHEFTDLQRMFTRYADVGASLTSWY